jgi:hypothetical protein
MKNIDNKRKRKYYGAFHMRLAAKLLNASNTNSRIISSINVMLVAANFDKVAQSALEICCKNKEDSSFLGNPSTAVKFGFDIVKMASAKLGLALKQEAKDFMDLMKME